MDSDRLKELRDLEKTPLRKGWCFFVPDAKLKLDFWVPAYPV
jgi:hypothetical protein